MSSLRIINVSSPPTPRLLRACAAFGLALRRSAKPGGPRRARDARRILRGLALGQVALITGPSGGGKSSLLEDIGRQAARRREPVLPLPLPSREAPIIDLIPGPLAHAIAVLARAGLADATLLARTPSRLSEGERFRLRLALAMASIHRAAASRGDRTGRARCGVTLLIDEFASMLDRTTARCLCLALRRWLDRAGSEGVRVVVATAHHDVARWLEPEWTVVVPLGGAPLTIAALESAPAMPIREAA
jgi:uncharacterized protein